MNTKKSTEYRSKDFSESAFLYASGMKLLRTDKEFINPRFLVWFIFKDENRCNQLVESYWQQTAMIDAKTLCDGMRTIRVLVHRSQRGLTSGETL